MVVVVCAYRLKASSRGRALLAVRENEVAAEAVPRAGSLNNRPGVLALGRGVIPFSPP
ncbi:MAG TPA: hypothetical protein VF516_00910 [Kofleriaceae bacterium]